MDALCARACIVIMAIWNSFWYPVRKVQWDQTLWLHFSGTGQDVWSTYRPGDYAIGAHAEIDYIEIHDVFPGAIPLIESKYIRTDAAETIGIYFRAEYQHSRCVLRLYPPDPIQRISAGGVEYVLSVIVQDGNYIAPFTFHFTVQPLRFSHIW